MKNGRERDSESAAIGVFAGGRRERDTEREGASPGVRGHEMGHPSAVLGGVGEPASPSGGEAAPVARALLEESSEDGGGAGSLRRKDGRRVAHPRQAHVLLLRRRRRRSRDRVSGALRGAVEILEDVGAELSAAGVPRRRAVRERPVRAPRGRGEKRRSGFGGLQRGFRGVCEVEDQSVLGRTEGGAGERAEVSLLRLQSVEYGRRELGPSQRRQAAGIASLWA